LKFCLTAALQFIQNRFIKKMKKGSASVVPKDNVFSLLSTILFFVFIFSGLENGGQQKYQQCNHVVFPTTT